MPKKAKASMKRVFLLVCLIVSLVELDWERDRIYLFWSIASLLLILFGELTQHRKRRKAELGAAFNTSKPASFKGYVSDEKPPNHLTDDPEKTNAAIQEVAFLHSSPG